MKTIIDIIEAGGGWERFLADRDGVIKVESPSAGYMPLTVERIGTGPRGGHSIAVSHHYIQNGDCMFDPEVVFEVSLDWRSPKAWMPIEVRMDGMGYHRRACWKEDGKVLVSPAQVRDLQSFSRTWNKNLREQGFLRKWKEQLSAPHILKMPVAGDDDIEIIEMED